MENGKAVGVEIFDGMIVRAKTVVSSLDPQSTFLKLVGEQHLTPALKNYVKNWAWDKTSFFTTHLALKEPVQYKADERDIDKSFMNIIGIDTPDDLVKMSESVRQGKIDKIAGHCSVETIYDRTLAQVAGHHTAFFQMLVPGQISGSWEDRKKEVESKVMETWQKYTKNLGNGNIVMTTSESPLDIERRIPCMKYGSIKHGEYNPLQMGYFRPNDLCSRTNTPIDGLYVCGASTNPGGLIIGGPGYIAANKIAEDLGVKKWWKYSDSIERYVKQYIDD
jgi:phytoene dehydrogenase-like protein